VRRLKSPKSANCGSDKEPQVAPRRVRVAPWVVNNHRRGQKTNKSRQEAKLPPEIEQGTGQVNGRRAHLQALRRLARLTCRSETQPACQFHQRIGSAQMPATATMIQNPGRRNSTDAMVSRARTSRQKR